MATTTMLQDTLRQKHDELCERLAVARTMTMRPEQSRRGCPPIDLFLARTSQHLHAVDAVLVPAVRSQCSDGSELVHAYLRTAKELEVVLAHVKAHEFGSAWETTFDWERVWSDVDVAMAAEWDVECRMADHLVEQLPEEQLTEVAGRFDDVESHAPTRPHPYLPHTGAAGRVVRRMMRVADAFWDAVEGRFVPEPDRKPRKRPGLIGQYLMADPRFEAPPAPDGEPEHVDESWTVPRQNARRDHRPVR